MKVTTALNQYGLSDNEAGCYLYLLKMIEATAYEVAQNIHVPRTTVYKSLETLKQKNLISSFKKNGKSWFTAESPKQLTYELTKKQETIESVMPQLNALINSSDIKPEMRMYEGKEGLKRVWEDVLETAQKGRVQELYGVAHMKMFELLPHFFPRWVKRRVDLGIKVKTIFHDSEEARVIEERAKHELREQKYLPKGHHHQCTMEIYGSKLAFFALKEREVHSIILESPAIAEMFRAFFLSMWELLP